MVKHSCGPLDLTFAALADPTRRGVLLALQAGSRSVTELAARSQMSLPGFIKHLRALEDAGLLRRRKSGRVVTCTLTAAPMREAARWLAKYEAFWNERLDALGRYLDQQEIEPWKQSARSPHSRSSASSMSNRPRSGARGRSRKR